MKRDSGSKTAKFLGVVTAVSGGSLTVAPGISLQVMGAEDDNPAPLLFRIIGMFMMISGGLLADGRDSPTVLKWSILQKAAASTAVAGGVAVGQFHPRALALAAFDGASAIVLARVLRRR
jgi:hypothetical protein